MMTIKSFLFVQKECENGAEIMQELSRGKRIIDDRSISEIS
jgi:hypothetical protein